MITSWTYTDIPDGIDLTRPLMPLRDDTDDGIYGVDPAWLHEVMSVWSAICGLSPVKEEMPERPSADWHNRLRSMAQSFGVNVLKSAPTDAFASESDLVSLAALSEGDIPEAVAAGDDVKRTDISGFYDWMKLARCISKYVPANIPPLEYVESGWHIDNWDDNPVYHTPPPAGTIYRWYWEYVALDNLTGGYSIRHTANPFTCSSVCNGVRAEWIQSASVFAKFSGDVYDSDGDSTTKMLYLPLSDVAISQTAEGLAVSASVSPAEVRSALGIADPPYSTGSTRYLQYSISMYSTLIVFLNLASDYRHPST